MSRIRSVHPGLFTDEAFMEASPFAKVLIIGLWCEAYDDGVFDWKPIVLKARLFPADTVDLKVLLGELEAMNVIKKFMVNDKPYGVVRNFRKWQRPQKPNSSGVLSVEMAAFAGFSLENEERSEARDNLELQDQSNTNPKPVRNQSRTDTVKPNPMEDVGDKMEEESATAIVDDVSKKSEKPPKSIFQKPESDPNWPDGYPAELLVKAVDHRNLDLSKSGGLATGGGTIAQWGLNGCSWDYDVVPIVKAICAKSKKQIGSFAYFTEAVFAARDERIRQGPTAPTPKRVALSQDERHSIDAVAGFREWRGYGAPWPQGYQKPSGPLLEKALASHGDDDDRDRWRREKQIARERSPPKITASQAPQSQPEMHA